MLVVLIKLIKSIFLRIAVLLFLLATVSCIPFGYDNSMVDPESGSKQLVEAVSITVDLTNVAQTINRKFIPKRSGQYVIRYIFTYKDKTKVPTNIRYSYGMPQSLTGTIEILDGKENTLVSMPLKHAGEGYHGITINLFDTSETGKNELLILRVSNLKIDAEDLKYASEIEFSLFQRSNYLWVW